MCAQTIDAALWGTDNRVFALARIGDTLYAGGAFRGAGPSTGSAVALPKHCADHCADRRKPFPKVAGYVYSIASDGHGGWFLSGNFTVVGGVPRYSLAHVLADGTVAPWNPNPNHVPYGAGGGLLVSGNTVYVSGGFATISGKPRQYIAALDATTGEALDWDAHSNGLVAPLAIRGNTLYVGGYFSEIGGQLRNNIAALDATTGDATPWNPDADGGVGSLILRDSSAYVGGQFAHIGGQQRAGLAELDLETGLATNWNPSPGPGYAEIDAMCILGDQLYVGGEFDTLSGQPRRCLASFDLTSGRPTAWDPQPGTARGIPLVTSLLPDGRSVYVCGFFNSVGGKPRNFVAELDALTGEATDWNPDPLNNVWAVAVDDSTVYLGGWFQSLGMVARRNLAAFDLRTGRVTDWNPNPDGLIVYALAASEGKLYVGGDFSQIGGQPRADLAALDARTGLATGWNPGADQVVATLLVRDSTVYAGGLFQRIGGQAQRYLAAVDAVTGAVRDWNPDAGDWVTALAARGNTLYTGGWFWQMGGQIHRSLAAVDAVSGAVLPWQLDTDGVVNTLAAGDSTVYAGGVFQHVNGENRLNLLAFDATDGTLEDWAPSPNGPREDYYTASVAVLATRGNTVFVGGDFTTIAGQQRASLAALDGVTGELLDWDPNPDQSVHALEVSGDRLYAGGYFQAASGLPHLALMGVTFPGAEPPVPGDSLPPGPTVAMAPIRPNPIQSTAVIRYALPSATSVSLAIYDLQGRRVESLLEKQVQAAGEHQLSVSAEHLPIGCYFYRLEAGGVVRTQKAVVVR
ncbi:MAG: T9SS type A sorting domain-containing protein [Candidatus Eisenbacteria bacterium]|nr:T9SS type A sorting domain-containing protein [Candidatus Eisenbacteria bacterium]